VKHIFEYFSKTYETILLLILVRFKHSDYDIKDVIKITYFELSLMLSFD